MVSTALRLSGKENTEGKAQVIIKLTINGHCRPCIKTHVFINRKYFKPVNKNRNGKGHVWKIVPPKLGKNNRSIVDEIRHKNKVVNDKRIRLEAISEAFLENGQYEVSKAKIIEAYRLTRDDSIANMAGDQLMNLINERKMAERHCDKSLWELLEQFLEERDISEGRKKSYRVLFRALMRYQSYTRRTDERRQDFTIDIDTLDKGTVDDFFVYMLKEKDLEEKYPKMFAEIIAETDSNPIRRRGSNTIVYHKKRLKAFWNWLTKKGYTSNNPVADLKTGTAVYGTPSYISVNERKKIAAADLPLLWDRYQTAIASGEIDKKKELPLSTLLVQRDIFIFQCLVGCRFCDLVELTSANVSEDGTVLSYIADKTKKTNPITIKVPLLKEGQVLIRKYRGVDKDGRLFPFITDQRYNDAIKQIFRLCGLDYTIQVRDSITGLEKDVPICEVASSHMARRTFIGNLYNKVKDPSIICSMSGHAEDSKSFARYREIDMDVKRDTIQVIA